MNPNLRAAFLVGPLLLFLTVAYIVPFLGVIRWSVTLPELGFGQYGVAVSDQLVLSVLLRTLRICTIVTVLSVVFAYAITLIWVRGTRMQRLLVELCILIPFWISVLTRAFGWLALLSNHGIFNGWLVSLGLITEPLALVRNEFGVIVGMVHFLVPFAVFPLASSMRAVDERVLMAARGMAAGRVRIFWQVFMPMTVSGILGASLVVFVFGLGFFVTPAILGGGRSVMVAELIYLRIFQSPDWGLAAAISVILMFGVGGLLTIMMRQVRPGIVR
jgi:putative spermidine/putrescine transport system permease protein